MASGGRRPGEFGVNTVLLDDWEIDVKPEEGTATTLACAVNHVLHGHRFAAQPIGAATKRMGLDLVEDQRVAIRHGDLDDLDVTYRTMLAPQDPSAKVIVRFASIAATAAIVCNGVEVGRFNNQYLPGEVDLSGMLADGGELTVICRALNSWLESERRPRGRWKTKLVADQRLRHVRLGLLGRIPSWTPPVPVVGLAGPVTLTSTPPNGAAELVELTVCPAMSADLTTATLHVRFRTACLIEVTEATVQCHHTTASATRQPDGFWETTFVVTDAEPWWPHTHGIPSMYPVEITLKTADEASSNIASGRTGFRHITLNTGPDGDGFSLELNAMSLFWRGSAWMPIDFCEPWTKENRLRIELVRCRDAGMNMIRLTGITGWEQPEFTDLCDELGIAVWQDLPFATLDQPVDEPFATGVKAEIAHHVRRLGASPSVVVMCGATERQQQAAMLGLGPEVVTDALAARLLSEVVAEQAVGAVVVGCSPSGGHLPFAADSGVSHYYGVGAYLRPLTDARHASVRFTTECLAFANVPEPLTMSRFLGDGELAPTHARWKERVARDRGVGWDFDDVRDHYFRLVTGMDPVAVRWRDVGRYLELSRVVSSIVMTATMNEWRRPSSSCGGAVTWFLRDLWRGAGWGVVDSDGLAKAAFHGLAEAWAPTSIALTDEGVNGVDVWVHNDGPAELSATIELSRVAHGSVVGQFVQHPVTVRAHSSVRLHADEVTGFFTDPSNAYLFGPSAHDAVCVRLISAAGTTLARNVLDTSGGRSLHRDRVGVEVSAEWTSEHTLALDVRSAGLSRFVRVEDEAVVVERHHVDIVPGETRRLLIHAQPGEPFPAVVHLAAVNSDSTHRVVVPPRPTSRST